jgi:hypothetical protein
MALIDRLLLRNPQEAQRARALREFRRIMPKRGRFSELGESGITTYFDRRFGAFEPALDRWEGGHTSALRSNPQLRRIDVVTDQLFRTGHFSLVKYGDLRSKEPPYETEGLVAILRLRGNGGRTFGVLSLDIGSEIRFSKLRLGTEDGRDYLVRLSTLDGGMIVGPNQPQLGKLPESVNERAAYGSEAFQTITETIAAMERLIHIPGK